LLIYLRSVYVGCTHGSVTLRLPFGLLRWLVDFTLRLPQRGYRIWLLVVTTVTRSHTHTTVHWLSARYYVCYVHGWIWVGFFAARLHRTLLPPHTHTHTPHRLRFRLWLPRSSHVGPLPGYTRLRLFFYGCVYTRLRCGCGYTLRTFGCRLGCRCCARYGYAAVTHGYRTRYLPVDSTVYYTHTPRLVHRCSSRVLLPPFGYGSSCGYTHVAVLVTGLRLRLPHTTTRYGSATGYGWLPHYRLRYHAFYYCRSARFTVTHLYTVGLPHCGYAVTFGLGYRLVTHARSHFAPHCVYGYLTRLPHYGSRLPLPFAITATLLRSSFTPCYLTLRLFGCLPSFLVALPCNYSFGFGYWITPFGYVTHTHAHYTTLRLVGLLRFCTVGIATYRPRTLRTFQDYTRIQFAGCPHAFYTRLGYGLRVSPFVLVAGYCLHTFTHFTYTRFRFAHARCPLQLRAHAHRTHHAVTHLRWLLGCWLIAPPHVAVTFFLPHVPRLRLRLHTRFAYTYGCITRTLHTAFTVWFTVTARSFPVYGCYVYVGYAVCTHGCLRLRLYTVALHAHTAVLTCVAVDSRYVTGWTTGYGYVTCVYTHTTVYVTLPVTHTRTPAGYVTYSYTYCRLRLVPVTRLRLGWLHGLHTFIPGYRLRTFTVTHHTFYVYGCYRLPRYRSAVYGWLRLVGCHYHGLHRCTHRCTHAFVYTPALFDFVLRYRVCGLRTFTLVVTVTTLRDTVAVARLFLRLRYTVVYRTRIYRTRLRVYTRYVTFTFPHTLIGYVYRTHTRCGL